MKIAVVGGGVFGTTISWYLAKNGFQIDLYLKKRMTYSKPLLVLINIGFIEVIIIPAVLKQYLHV